MRSLRLGVAGLRDTGDPEGSIKTIVDAGFTACEVQFVKEFTLKEKQAARLGQIARDEGVALSVHAPYFAQLTTKEADRLKLHLGALHHSCKLAAAMGATIVVCHPGSRGEATDSELFERVGENLEALGPRVADTGVRLGLETCGRKSQFGEIGHLAGIVREHPFTSPVIDFAHVHAVLGGRLGSGDAFRTLFEFITQSFEDSNLSPLHCHFNDNEWGAAGEIRHVPYGKGQLRASNLLEGASGYDIALTVISESKEMSSHKAILEELREAGAPLTRRGEAADRGAGPPLESRGGAHWFRRGGRELRITNIDKVLFPGEGFTKRDLVTYYYNAAPMMLPFLKDRPVVMQRVPEGIEGEAFYEKQAPKGRPEWVRTVAVPSEKRGTIDFVVVDDTTALLWLAQIASVECHAWTSRYPALEEPDFAVIDLDPHEPISFDEVRAVARHVKAVLDALGLRGFPKTSGGAGIQVFIPLAPGHTYPQVREFVAGVGRLIRSADPDRVTMEPSKVKRAGKVFIDANQNAWGKTLVAPYSVRPYPGAPVSTPLTWDEIEEEFYPELFTIATVPSRALSRPDPFAPSLTLRQDLHPTLSRLKA